MHQPTDRATTPTLVYTAPARNPVRKRTPALQRPPASQRRGLRLTARDVGMIRALHTYRALTAVQLNRLFFASPAQTEAKTVSSRCQYRLKLLFHHGLVDRDAPPTKYTEGRKPLVYFLDRAGADLLASRDGLTPAEIAWRPQHNDVTWPFLTHLLHGNDVRIAVTLACRRLNARLHAWHDERRLRSREMKEYVVLPVRSGRRRIALVPDGYFHLSQGRYQYHHFLEVDMGTETVGAWGHGANRKTFAQKIAAYLSYYQSGQYTRRYGTRAIRVLVVTTSAARLHNLRQMTNRLAGRQRDLFWFTTFAQLHAATVLDKPIWRVGERTRSLPLLGAPPSEYDWDPRRVGEHQPPLLLEYTPSLRGRTTAGMPVRG